MLGTLSAEGSAQANPKLIKGVRPMSRQDALLERFLRYVAVPTQSDPKAKVVPSNPNEFQLAELLA